MNINYKSFHNLCEYMTEKKMAVKVSKKCNLCLVLSVLVKISVVQEHVFQNVSNVFSLVNNISLNAL